MSKERNIVHKHALEFQRCKAYKDRKKLKKKGYAKHKPSKSEGFLFSEHVLSSVKYKFGLILRGRYPWKSNQS